ncbi:MAG: ferritin family protein [Bacillota bacterium]|nr:ferritin family protein [Bacillota bacterium]
MNDLKGSKTYDNLLIAFAGESQARNKYTFFASKAKEEGYREMAAIFEETAANEKEHAELWYKHFAGIGTTEENLLVAAEGEHYEWSEMYADMAQVARNEGFTEIAEQMMGVAAIEKFHEERYLKLREDIRSNQVFEKNEEVTWICTNCGHHHSGSKAPQICPVCKHERGYFKCCTE